MGIFEKFASSIEKKTTSIADYTWSELFPQSNSKSGVAVNIDTSLRVTTVFACARVLAEGIAQLPVCIYSEDASGDRTEVKDNTLSVLGRVPNDWMTSFTLREQMTIHAVLTGNAYAYLGFGGTPATLQEIIPLVPGSVQVVRKVDWTLEYYVSDLAGVTTVVPPENILHLRGPSWNGYLGMEAIQLAREAIGLAITTEETHASLHANGAQPGGVLSVKGKLDAPAKERLKAAWQDFQGGVANRFKTAVLDVDATWTPLQMNGVDAQHLETRRFQIEEICRAMRVFPQMVMHTDKTSTFASAEAFFLSHVTHSLMPWVKRWQEALDKALYSQQPNMSVKLSVNELLRGSAADRASFYMSALGGARGETAYLTRNEVRKLEGYNPIEGGDKLLIPPVPAAPIAGTKPPPSPSSVKEVLEYFDTKYNPNHDDRGRFDSGSGFSAASLYQQSSKTAEQLVANHGAADYVANVEGKLAQSTPTNASVASGGHVGPNGEYTPERQALHDSILKTIFSDDKVANATPGNGIAPVLSVIGGRGGSGKSFITKPGGPVDSAKSILLDSDALKAALGSQGWDAANYHEEATTLLDKADQIASGLGVNVTHDATLKSLATSSARIAMYEDKGYKVNGYFVSTTPENAVGRALGRAMKPGGRYVPADVILGNTKNESNFDALKPRFSKYSIYDNNGSKPVLKGSGGK